MTDKQIIIDDQKETIHRLQQECTEKTDTIIALGEQLQAKEQECEELKENLPNAITRLMGELDQLKTENEKLKKLLKVRIEDLCDSCGASSMMPMPCKVYEKTLTDIKQIMKKHCKKCKKHKFYDFQLCCTCKYTDILQKISEVAK